jgi:hypothetical protein
MHLPEFFKSHFPCRHRRHHRPRKPSISGSASKPVPSFQSPRDLAALAEAKTGVGLRLCIRGRDQRDQGKEEQQQQQQQKEDEEDEGEKEWGRRDRTYQSRCQVSTGTGRCPWVSLTGYDSRCGEGEEEEEDEVPSTWRNLPSLESLALAKDYASPAGSSFLDSVLGAGAGESSTSIGSSVRLLLPARAALSDCAAGPAKQDRALNVKGSRTKVKGGGGVSNMEGLVDRDHDEEVDDRARDEENERMNPEGSPTMWDERTLYADHFRAIHPDAGPDVGTEELMMEIEAIERQPRRMGMHRKEKRGFRFWWKGERQMGRRGKVES